MDKCIIKIGKTGRTMWITHRLPLKWEAFHLPFPVALLFWVISQGKYSLHKDPSVCGCLCVYVCMRLCLFEKYWKADWKPRQETIAGINQLHSPSFPDYSVKCRWSVFLMVSSFQWSWVQVRVQSVSQSHGVGARFRSGLVCNAPLLSSNSSIGLNWANPGSKECLKFTN